MAKREFDPIHPGEILLEEFLQPMGISQFSLAKDISVAQCRISEITQGKRSIAAYTALRLCRFFGMEAQFWLYLQSRYDLLCAEAKLDERLEKEVTPHAAYRVSSNQPIKPTRRSCGLCAPLDYHRQF